MRGHTAQHLLHWAFTNELASWSSDSSNSSQLAIVHHGSQVEPDRCSVYLTLVESPEKLETLVEKVESRCQAVVRANLPIVSQEVELDRVVEVLFSYFIQTTRCE